ncbi:hypothetical protein [Streptomyces sp. NPDC018693]|uniref:hypothetical protein n=1 Tax=unclassified Streptomyces TaxID=2593676 RepID=UPI0037B7E8F8
MGIESDQVVYEYLSRVGDVAQQRQLSSATRMRLVNELRDEIDKRRAKAPADSPAAVRRIIARLGTPDDVVTAAADTGPAVPQTPTPAVPTQRDGAERSNGFWSKVPGPRPAEPVPDARPTVRQPGDRPDWWLGGPLRPDARDDDIPGFVGGIEIPDLLKPPRPKTEEPEEAEPQPEPEQAEADEPKPRRRLFTVPTRRWSNPLLLLGAACLVVGAVLGQILPLLAGWLIAYASRRLSDAETKWAVMWLPGAAVAGGLVWLWGRTDGRWGEPIAEGQMSGAIGETWPWVLRGAAIASAVFVVWRSQRRK